MSFSLILAAKVRVIAFKSGDAGQIESLAEVFVGADEFYQMLRNWVELFEQEWRLAPKNEFYESLTHCQKTGAKIGWVRLSKAHRKNGVRDTSSA